MKLILLDVVRQTWFAENRRDILVLTILSLVAIGSIVGIFIWVKKRKNK
jgi:hypothetical protein